MHVPIKRWGRKSQPIDYSNRLPDYPQCVIIIICQGSLRVEWMDGHKSLEYKDLEEHTVLLLAPGTDFRLSTPHSGYAGHLVEVEPQDCPWPAEIVIAQSDMGVQRCVADIESEFERGEDLSAIPLLYELLLCRCAQLFNRQRNEENLIEQVNATLRANAVTDANLSEILKHFPYSERHLRRLYQEQAACSIKQAFIQIKLDEAKRLLKQTNMPITAIAHELSYPSSQYFSGLFKQYVHLTPSAYRDQFN